MKAVHTKKPYEEAYKQCTCKYCLKLKKQEETKMENKTKVKLIRTGAIVIFTISLIMIYFANMTIGIGTLGICSAVLIHRLIDTNYKEV